MCQNLRLWILPRLVLLLDLIQIVSDSSMLSLSGTLRVADCHIVCLAVKFLHSYYTSSPYLAGSVRDRSAIADTPRGVAMPTTSLQLLTTFNPAPVSNLWGVR